MKSSLLQAEILLLMGLKKVDIKDEYLAAFIYVGYLTQRQMDKMTSSNGNIFPRPRWIPRTKASDAELLCFLWSASK